MESWLLLHGALGSCDQLKPLKSILQENELNVFCVNFSGHGSKQFNSEFGIAQFAKEVEEFIHTNSISPISIFGYSMGGYVATWLALQRPGLVKRIVTLGTKFDWSPASAEKEISKMDPEKIELKIPAFARILEHRHKPNDWKLLMSKTSDMMCDLGNQPLLTESNLKSITTKIQIVLGDQDDMADQSFSKQVAAWLPNGKFLNLDQTPHPIEKVDVKKLADLIVHGNV